MNPSEAMARIRMFTLCIRAKSHGQTVRKVLNTKVHDYEQKTYGTINPRVPVFIKEYFKLTIEELTAKIDEMVSFIEETTETRQGELFKERTENVMIKLKVEKTIDGYIERSRHNVGPMKANIERDKRILELYVADKGREEIRAIIITEFGDDISPEGISHAKRRALNRLGK